MNEGNVCAHVRGQRKKWMMSVGMLEGGNERE